MLQVDCQTDSYLLATVDEFDRYLLTSCFVQCELYKSECPAVDVSDLQDPGLRENRYKKHQ